MLRRKSFVPIFSALATLRHQSDDNKKSSSGDEGFSFKRGPNAQRLSSISGNNKLAAAPEPTAAEIAAEKAADAARRAAIREKQQRERAPFLGMLNRLNEKAEAANGEREVPSPSSSSASASPSSSSSSSASKTTKSTRAQPAADADDEPSSSSSSPLASFVTALKNRPSKFMRSRREGIAMERKKRLVFRDESDGKLDRFNIFSDPLLFLKYVRYGTEFAADSELERRLRYYKEHVSKEIMTCDGGKLMRGPPHLFPLKPALNVAAASGITGSGAPTTGPLIGIKGFIVASLANTNTASSTAAPSSSPSSAPATESTPKEPAPSPVAAKASGEKVQGISVASGEYDDKKAAENNIFASEEKNGGASSTAAAKFVYTPASHPNQALLLPRIVASHLPQFIPSSVLPPSSSSSKAASSSNNSPPRINGAYNRKFLAVDDISKEERITAASTDSNTTTPPAIWTPNTTQHVFNGGNFRRPAMLVISQLGLKIATEANNAWCCAALNYLEPNSPFITLFNDACNTGNVYGRSMRDIKSVTRSGSDATIKETMQNEKARALEVKMAEAGVSVADVAATPPPSSTSASKSLSSSRAQQPLKRPIDLYCLRSLDVQQYAFVDRMMVKRFASSLDKLDEQLKTAAALQQQTSQFANNSSTSSSTSPFLFGSLESVAQHTFIGKKLLTNFFAEPFSLRNYLATTVLLVDHHGRVRWISGGKPDEQERVILPRLLKDLETEYLGALSGSKR